MPANFQFFTHLEQKAAPTLTQTQTQTHKPPKPVTMELIIPRFPIRLFSLSSLPPTSKKSLFTPFLTFNNFSHIPTSYPQPVSPNLDKPTRFLSIKTPISSSNLTARAGWLLGLGENKKKMIPDLVKAGDPVLHEPAREVDPNEIGSERIQKIIDDMIGVMRKAPGVGLAAPQIGIPLKIIVLEDTKEYISYAPKTEIKAQDRCPFDLLK